MHIQLLPPVFLTLLNYSKYPKRRKIYLIVALRNTMVNRNSSNQQKSETGLSSQATLCRKDKSTTKAMIRSIACQNRKSNSFCLICQSQKLLPYRKTTNNPTKPQTTLLIDSRYTLLSLQAPNHNTSTTWRLRLMRSRRTLKKWNLMLAQKQCNPITPTLNSC